MSLNPDTLTVACCWTGDAHLIEMARDCYAHHETPVLILSPADSPVRIPGFECRSMGRRAYIGQESLDRQREHLETLLTFSQQFFLVNDADSLCLSAKIPERFYELANETLFSSVVVEPRPHLSPYPKLAFQPPYFFSRRTLERLLSVAYRVPAHPITPYIDWWMVALCFEAGLKYSEYSPFEHPPRTSEPCPHPEKRFENLIYRIKFTGAVMVHPFKCGFGFDSYRRARSFYEEQTRKG